MSKTLGWIFWLSFVVALMGSVHGGLWYGWYYPKTYEYSLRLADDASLPHVKAEYLTDYLNTIDSIRGEPRYVFKRPDLNLDKQRGILRGLIQRFEDISQIPPSEMAYQQGMEQLTGQEMDHLLDRISTIFKQAKIRENPLLFFWIWITVLLGWPIMFITGCWWMIEIS